jgi:tetratricopeptide (TPR) repeat protein
MVGQWNGALPLHDDPTRELTTEIDSAVRRGDLDAAEEKLARLRAAAPAAVETRGLELSLLLRRNRLDDAARLADQVVEQFPASARIWYLAGLVAYRRKRYEVAEERLRESDRIHPHDRTRRQIGKALTQLGRLEAAEPILLDLVDRHPECRIDLAWLYERRETPERALEELDLYLKSRPDDRFAASQRLRLRAEALGLAEIRQEVETLCELGEDVPGEFLPRYCESLVHDGEFAELRRFVAERANSLEPYVASRMAWQCYRLAVWDVALDLFLRALPVKRHDEKLVTTMLAAARRCGREAEAREALKN